MSKKVIQSNTTPVLPLVVIVGPTASGKTATAIQVAKAFNGEIICADSRSIYKGMDVGTAKPTIEEQQGIPHWGLDLMEPGERFTAADFKYFAQQKIEEIRARGRVPVLVGGTGLYVDGIIFDYEFTKTDLDVRAKLEKQTLSELKDYCSNNNIPLPENHQNPRHVMSAILRKSVNGKRLSVPIDNCIIVGIATERDILRTRIEARSEQLFESGMVEEAKMLGEKYGWNSEAMTGNIYPLVRQYLAGELNEKELKERFIISDWQLAKRQLTWLRRNPYIEWKPLNEAFDYIAMKLGERQETE